MENARETVIEPFRVAATEPLGFTTREERERALRDAGGDLSRLPAGKILIDLSGSGPAAAAGARGPLGFEAAVRELTGLRRVLAVRRGSAAGILFRAAGSGRLVFSNGPFDAAGADARAFPAPEAFAHAAPAPFKGDMDLRALEAAVREAGAARVAMIVMQLTSGSLGGQPVSLENLRAVRELSRHHRIPLFLDAARLAGNAWLIARRERGHATRPPVDIARELFSLCDGAWTDDFLALNDAALAAACRGGGEPADGAPDAGLIAELDERSLSHHVRSLESLGEGLRRAGVPIVEPTGGHAVCVDAARLPSLARELYLASGVRAGEEGPLVRLAVPRGAYTLAHLNFAAEAVAAAARAEVPA